MDEQTTYIYDVFVSYCPDDEHWVQTFLLPQLEEAGLRVCIGYRDFRFGTPILINIEQAVQTSRYTLLITTPAWLDYEWGEFESLLAGTLTVNVRSWRLIPLKLVHCQLPPRISQLQAADFTRTEDRYERLHYLLNQLRNDDISRASEAELPCFIAGLPINRPEHFFGRRYIIRRIFNLLRRTPLQNIALIGPRRSGKTSLLLHLMQLAESHPTALRLDQRELIVP